MRQPLAKERPGQKRSKPACPRERDDSSSQRDSAGPVSVVGFAGDSALCSGEHPRKEAGLFRPTIGRPMIGKKRAVIVILISRAGRRHKSCSHQAGQQKRLDGRTKGVGPQKRATGGNDDPVARACAETTRSVPKGGSPTRRPRSTQALAEQCPGVTEESSEGGRAKDGCRSIDGAFFSTAVLRRPHRGADDGNGTEKRASPTKRAANAARKASLTEHLRVGNPFPSRRRHGVAAKQRHRACAGVVLHVVLEVVLKVVFDVVLWDVVLDLVLEVVLDVVFDRELRFLLARRPCPDGVNAGGQTSRAQRRSERRADPKNGVQVRRQSRRTSEGGKDAHPHLPCSLTYGGRRHRASDTEEQHTSTRVRVFGKARGAMWRPRERASQSAEIGPLTYSTSFLPQKKRSRVSAPRDGRIGSYDRLVGPAPEPPTGWRTHGAPPEAPRGVPGRTPPPPLLLLPPRCFRDRVVVVPCRPITPLLVLRLPAAASPPGTYCPGGGRDGLRAANYYLTAEETPPRRCL
ncbi:hypothetical protein HPB47_010758 [Ixodes persulcatus]|uniref:Uncharacterized protein n=1 Tax=Ixodes persulcatus TaxID=34615 RepID=A0AC60NY94_IXOPE|nr:hypothetical protein HPB47_010758 [Ixodes persulcatus]